MKTPPPYPLDLTTARLWLCFLLEGTLQQATRDNRGRLASLRIYGKTFRTLGQPRGGRLGESGAM